MKSRPGALPRKRRRRRLIREAVSPLQSAPFAHQSKIVAGMWAFIPLGQKPRRWVPFSRNAVLRPQSASGAQLPVCRHNRPICAHAQGMVSLRASVIILVRRLERRASEVREAPSGKARRNISSTCWAVSKAAMTPSRPAGSAALDVFVWGTRCRGWDLAARGVDNDPAVEWFPGPAAWAGQGCSSAGYA